nr:calmodulin-1 isoform X1 [Pongo abelii]
MNGLELAGGAHCSGRVLRGAVSARHLPTLAGPAGRPPLVALPSFPGGAEGARRGRRLGRKEPGKGGVGGRKARGWGRRGRKRRPGRPAHGRGPAVWPWLVPAAFAPCGPLPSAAVRAGVSLGAPGGLSRGRRSARANWGGGGRGRRELARGLVSIRDAKFLLREEAAARRASRLGEQKRVGGAGGLGRGPGARGPGVVTLLAEEGRRPDARSGAALPPACPRARALPGPSPRATSSPERDALHVSAFSAASRLPDATVRLAGLIS